MLRKPSGLIAMFGIAGAVLAGCGSSSPSQPAATKTLPAHQTRQMSRPDSGGSRQQDAHPAVGRQLSGHPAAALGQVATRGSHAAQSGSRKPATASAVVAATQTPTHSIDDNSTTRAKGLNPCTLVSLSEAQAITAGAITKLTEAPLGPTCIYSRRGNSAGITLALETESFSQVTRRMSAPEHVVVSGHPSICGRLGTQMLFVPLGRYHLLNVTAPCGIAQRFAALAVSRISA